MSLPMTREQWERLQKTYPEQYRIDERDAIERAANWLIERLYKPHAEIGYVRDWSLERQLKDEPINWGDLSAEVERQGDVWVVLLEEAAGDKCPRLCAYIQDWLMRWGWPSVVVKTAW